MVHKKDCIHGISFCLQQYLNLQQGPVYIPTNDTQQMEFWFPIYGTTHLWYNGQIHLWQKLHYLHGWNARIKDVLEGDNN